MNPNLSILVEALVKADLATTLDKAGDKFTVFAPTNEAFTAFLKAKKFASLNDVPTPVLKQILLNHVLSNIVLKSSDITTSYFKTMATGGASSTNTLSMFINKGDNLVINGGVTNMGATINTTDILASNGIIHVVDGVIDLPTVVNQAIANPNLATLVAALKFYPKTEFIEGFSGILHSPFTIFAPTNKAFTDFFTESEIKGLSEIPEEILISTLKYHVIIENNIQSKELTEGLSLKTLEDQYITINLTGGASIKDANNGVSKIILVDVQCSNGILHIIDKVLLPSLE